MLAHCVESLDYDLLHLGHQVVLDADIFVCVVLVNVVLELVETQLVSVFKLPVGLALDLHCIVCQVHKRVVHVLQIYAIVTTGGSQVALREEVQIRVMR